MTRLALLAAALLATGTALPTAALAQDAAHATVRFADLNLNDAHDVRTLARRIDGAVYYVCGGEPTSASERGAADDYRACRKDATAAALNTIASPLLTATVDGRDPIRLASR